MANVVLVGEVQAQQSEMEDKIFDIVTDLIRNDIVKNEAIDKLLYLYNVNR